MKALPIVLLISIVLPSCGNNNSKGGKDNNGNHDNQDNKECLSDRE